MLARKDLLNDPALSPELGGGPADIELHEVLNSDAIDTHTLLLLYLLPETNNPGIDAETVHAVEVLTDVQNRLCVGHGAAPFDEDKLAAVIESLSDIRFGWH